MNLSLFKQIFARAKRVSGEGMELQIWGGTFKSINIKTKAPLTRQTQLCSTSHYLWMRWGVTERTEGALSDTFQKGCATFVLNEWPMSRHTRPFGWRMLCGSPGPPDGWCSWRLQLHPLLSDSPSETTRGPKSPHTAGHQPTHPVTNSLQVSISPMPVNTHSYIHFKRRGF